MTKRYENVTKSQSRGWAWNRICDRIRRKEGRKRSRIFVLIGDTTKELETARSKGFSDHNVIGVDIREEPVKAWREQGGIAIQAPIDMVVALSKTPPNAVIADFCAGLDDTTYTSMLAALSHTVLPGCIVINLLRGRDKIKQFRRPHLLEMLQALGGNELEQAGKNRAYVLLTQIFFEHYYQDDNLDVDPGMSQAAFMQAMDQIHKTFDRQFGTFIRSTSPKKHSYQSADSNQYFDSLAINPIPNFELSKPIKWTNTGFDEATVRRRLAAMEAIRTQRLQKLPERKRRQLEAA